MENLPEVFKFFGMDPTTMATLSLVIFALMEGIKSQFNGFLSGGWKTKLVTFALSFLITLYYFMQQPETLDFLQVVIVTLLMWIAPAGFHRVIKKVETPPVE